MIRFKPGVRVSYFSSALACILHKASIWSLRERIDVEVNSIDDPAPGRDPNTRHGDSLAVDLDTAGDSALDGKALAAYLWRVLPDGYDVVLEKDHVHVERDVHRAPVTIKGSK